MKGWISLAVACACGIAGAQQAQIIARLRPDVNAALVAAKHHLVLADYTEKAPFALFNVPAGALPDDIQADLMRDRQVMWAEDNAEVVSPEGQGGTKGSTMPAIGGRSDLYAVNANILGQINFSQGLAQAPGRTVKIAILDTGLSPQQWYLWSNVVGGMNFIERGRRPLDVPRGTNSNHNQEVDEGVGHGTMIAGLVDQISPQAKLLIARIADSDGNATAWTVTQGLAFAVVNGAEVANLSMGSTEAIPALSDVMDWCEENRLLVVAGIGNDDTDRALYPARITKVVCVSGLDPVNVKADFSNWDGHCDSAAPATGIISQWWDGHMGTWNGTSFSSPMVAAAIADCLRRTPGPQPLGAIRDAVTNSGRNINNLNPQFEDELGTLLDIQRLNQFIVGTGRPARKR
jgi:subtilisin family serine protease